MPKRYKAEFKKEIVSMYAEGGRSAKSLSNELGIHENTIYKWAEQYRRDPDHAFPGSGNMKPEMDELRRAQRRIREHEEDAYGCLSKSYWVIYAGYSSSHAAYSGIARWHLSSRLRASYARRSAYLKS